MDTTQTTPAPRPSVDALVFDAYGTLFDVQALTAQCEADWPGQGAAVSALWRGTQLEYAWLRSLMGRYADFERITALAMGRNWRQATPEQQKLLVEQFRTLLVRTYSGALAQYRNQTMDYKPLRAEPNATEVTVRTEVVRQGQAPVQIDYSMAKAGNDWKAYDVIVAGVSLVTNYRDEFNEQIRSGGVDALIKSLTAKNGGAK